MKQMLTEVVFRGRKLYFVDGSCISWTEDVFRGRKLYSVDGSCGPTHVERNKICMV